MRWNAKGWGPMVLGAMLTGPVVAEESGAESEFEVGDSVTVVTAERLTYDSEKQYALFENDVVVTDAQLQLLADKLILRFTAEGQAESIRAEGNVSISQTDKKAVAEAASYDVETGAIVLTGSPRITRGRDVLSGDTIKFWRDSNKMVCEPRARLVIYPEQGAREQLLGD